VFFIPGDRTIDPIHNMFGFSEPVPFSWIPNKYGVNADIFQGYKILLGFSDRHVGIILAVNQ
jgi:LVIVD repeat